MIEHVTLVFAFGGQTCFVMRNEVESLLPFPHEREPREAQQDKSWYQLQLSVKSDQKHAFASLKTLPS